MILTTKTNLGQRYTPEVRENIVELLNTREVPVTLDAGPYNQPSAMVNIERMVGTVVKGSAHVAEDGQIEYDVNIMENLPLSKILATMVENVPEWTPVYSLSMTGTFGDKHPKVEKVICVDITVGEE